MEYFDKDNLIAPFGENGILFAAEYFRLRKMNNVDLPTDKEKAMKAIQSQQKSFTWLQALDGEPNSHDNHTAITSLSYQFGLDYHKQYFYRDWTHRIHPRDIGYYLYLRFGAKKYLSFLLVPTIISMIISCRYYIEKNGYPATSTKLLTWLRIETLDMKITRKICTYMINKSFGSWYELFNIYFRKDQNHPIVIQAKKLYNEASVD